MRATFEIIVKNFVVQQSAMIEHAVFVEVDAFFTPHRVYFIDL